MEASTVNTILARKTLSSKKATPKSIRSVLLTPRKNSRLIISKENETQITELITKLFGLHKSVPKVPWKEIQNIPKDKRKEFRENYLKENNKLESSIKKKHKCFVLGINRIIKKLENNQIMAVILDSDILEISTIYNFIFRLCELQQSSIILLENLGAILLNSIEIRSHTLGFTKQTDCSYFEPIVTTIKKLSCINESTPTNKSSNKVEKKLNVSEKMECMEVDKKHEPKKLYLYRDSSKTRVFTPSGLSSIMETNTNDYIAFSKTKERNDVEYVPLKVKKIISNEARKRKRISKKMKK